MSCCLPNFFLREIDLYCAQGYIVKRGLLSHSEVTTFDTEINERVAKLRNKILNGDYLCENGSLQMATINDCEVLFKKEQVKQVFIHKCQGSFLVGTPYSKAREGIFLDLLNCDELKSTHYIFNHNGSIGIDELVLNIYSKILEDEFPCLEQAQDAIIDGCEVSFTKKPPTKVSVITSTMKSPALDKIALTFSHLLKCSDLAHIIHAFSYDDPGRISGLSTSAGCLIAIDPISLNCGTKPNMISLKLSPGDALFIHPGLAFRGKITKALMTGIYHNIGCARIFN